MAQDLPYIPSGRLQGLVALAKQARSFEELLDIEERANEWQGSFTKNDGVLRQTIDERLALITRS